MNAAGKALDTGDVSSIQPKVCLYRTDEKSYQAYEETTLFQAWGTNESEDVKQRNMADISPPFQKIYSTYASHCCEVRLG